VGAGGASVSGNVNLSGYTLTCAYVNVGSSGIYSTGSIACTSLTASGGLNITGTYSGYGVYCPSYGVSCYSLTVGAGGLSVGGYSGSSNTITFTDSGGGYCKLNGSALRMEFNYGVFNGLI
jgi:hypothetical protein